MEGQLVSDITFPSPNHPQHRASKNSTTPNRDRNTEKLSPPPTAKEPGREGKEQGHENDDERHVTGEIDGQTEIAAFGSVDGRRVDRPIKENVLACAIAALSFITSLKTNKSIFLPASFAMHLPSRITFG